MTSWGDRFCPPYYNWPPSDFRAMRRLCSSLVFSFSISDSDCVLVSTCSPEWKKKILENNSNIDHNWKKKELETVFCYQNCEKKKISNYNDQENFLKFEAEGQESSKILRSLEQFIQKVKVRRIVGNRMLFYIVPWGFPDLIN